MLGNIMQHHNRAVGERSADALNDGAGVRPRMPS
jgi:hypothetical protein